MMRSLSRRRNERHIASKHGFGPANEQATRMAILTPPVTTTQVTKKKSVTGGRTNAGENGTGALTIAALPAVLAVIVALALYWKCSRGSRMGEWLAWIAIGLLGVFIFLSAMTIGLFALPVALLLGWAARLTSVSSAPAV